MNEGDRDPRHHSLAEIEDGIRSESPCSVPAVGDSQDTGWKGWAAQQDQWKHEGDWEGREG